MPAQISHFSYGGEEFHLQTNLWPYHQKTAYFNVVHLFIYPVFFIRFLFVLCDNAESWQQQRTEINELRNTVETQVIIINEQAQRLTNSDLLVKDLYVENSQLTAAIQRLEQQRSRNNMMLQHQGVPGML